MIKKLFLFAIVALAFTACNNNAAKDSEAVVTEQDEATTTEVLSVDQLENQIADLVGKAVTVAGDVDHVCKHGGTKMVILGDSTDIHIKATDESGNFRADEVMDHRVIVNGIVDEFRVDESYIMEQEAELEELIANGPQKEEATEEEEHGEGEKGMFPDNDSKHKKQIKGLQNQIANLKKMLEEAKAEGKDHISFYSVKAEDYKIDETVQVKSEAKHFDDGAAEMADEKAEQKEKAEAEAKDN
jgi:hypothetical protein